jgi:hypothetical protein
MGKDMREEDAKRLTKNILYIGLRGHSYPSKFIMAPVDLDVFEKYILER